MTDQKGECSQSSWSSCSNMDIFHICHRQNNDGIFTIKMFLCQWLTLQPTVFKILAKLQRCYMIGLNQILWLSQLLALYNCFRSCIHSSFVYMLIFLRWLLQCYHSSQAFELGQLCDHGLHNGITINQMLKSHLVPALFTGQTIVNFNCLVFSVQITLHFSNCLC